MKGSVPNQPHEPPLERGKYAAQVVTPLEHQSMFTDQCKRPLPQPQLGAFLYPHLRPLGSPPECREQGHVGIKAQSIIAPVTGRDHSSVQIEDAPHLGLVECRNSAPVPGAWERRDDAQARLLRAG